jgi:hypothetical protein
MTFLRIVIALQLFVLRMIFSENRYPLFGIMLWRSKHRRRRHRACEHLRTPTTGIRARDTISERRPNMWMKAGLATAFLAAATTAALAIGNDRNPANRGFPAYAAPQPPQYFNGIGQSRPAFHASSPAGLRTQQSYRPWR